MNGLERAFIDEHLTLLVRAGDLLEVGFQRIKVRLADRTWYTPDFDVARSDGTIEIYEVKGGHWEDDARVKLKVAAELYSRWRWYAVTRPRGQTGFTLEPIGPAARAAVLS